MYNEYDSIIARLNQGRLWDFPGGVHPPDLKSLSNQNEIARIPVAKRLYVTVKQHVGVEGSLIVQVGDRVLKGQALTRSTNPFAVPVHAPSSGEITSIAPHPSAHPSGLPELTVEIASDEFETWAPLTPLLDYQQKPKAKIIEAICHAGISGMGGAGFPTHIKASPKKNVEFLIINGVECEPYITSDDRLMREHAWQIRQGIDVLAHLLSPKVVLIAIEDNKPEAIAAMQVACQENARYRVIEIPTKYPAGGEKQLIQVLTNREVPKQGLPIDVGVMMHNVGTCFAVADAIFSGKPLIERVVTLTGEAFKRPQNVWAPLGTPISHLLDVGNYKAHRQLSPKLIMGGPMMGFEIVSPDVPVVKITNCILAPSSAEIQAPSPEQPCIRCSACADACPASLLPQQLFWHTKSNEYDKAQEYNLFDCIECGACAYVCPSDIPLVHYYRKAKADIRHQEHEKDQADKARMRFEARKERLEREHKEREEKHARAAEARRQAMQEKGNDAKDKIAAALARAKAKKQASADSNESAASPQTQESSKQDKVAAAIARAKAKKQQSVESNAQPSPDQSESSTPSKQEKVAAAIARAKAKKQQSADSDAQPSLDQSESSTPTKQQKVAAAIAKAKAKRAAASGSEQATQKDKAQPATSTDSYRPSSVADDVVNNAEGVAKDATVDKVSLAVAKAKAKRAAKKAAQQTDSDKPQGSSAKEESKEPSQQRKGSASDNINEDKKTTDTTATNTPDTEKKPPLSAAQIRQQKVEAAVAKAKQQNLIAKQKREAKKKQQEP